MSSNEDQVVPQFESPIPIENGKQLSMVVVCTLSIVIPSVFVGLRLYARTMTSRSLGMSDYFILIGLVFNIGLQIDCLLMVLHGGFGFHLMDVAQRFGPDTLTYFFKAIMAFCILWNVAICFSKLSVLWLYTTLMPMKKMLYPAAGLGIFIILWNTGNILGQLLICKPFAMNWDQTIPGGKCGSQRDFYFVMGVFNIITDVLILGLPMPFLYSLHLPMMKKLVLIGMFAIGIMTCAISIYRQITLPGLDFRDMTYTGLLATLFSALEPAVAITLACIPYLRPLLGRFATPTTTSNYKITGDKSMGRSSRARAFEELNDADGSGSEVQLQTMDPGFSVEASPPQSNATKPRKNTIVVERKWEVSSSV